MEVHCVRNLSNELFKHEFHKFIVTHVFNLNLVPESIILHSNASKLAVNDLSQYKNLICQSLLFDHGPRRHHRPVHMDHHQWLYVVVYVIAAPLAPVMSSENCTRNSY